ncbi:MAG: hypothetical protein WBG57_11950 [Ornithinimicrobium sp.]
MSKDIVAGILISESIVSTTAFGILMAFVALNTIMYTVLALGKCLPKVHFLDHLPRTTERAETRNIDPDAPA